MCSYFFQLIIFAKDSDSIRCNWTPNCSWRSQTDLNFVGIWIVSSCRSIRGSRCPWCNTKHGRKCTSSKIYCSNLEIIRCPSSQSCHSQRSATSVRLWDRINYKIYPKSLIPFKTVTKYRRPAIVNRWSPWEGYLSQVCNCIVSCQACWGTRQSSCCNCKHRTESTCANNIDCSHLKVVSCSRNYSCCLS